MDADQLIAVYPTLYHMAEKRTWDCIKNNGLLSTSALLDWFEISGDARFAIESCHRPKSVTISHPTRGTAVVRDQKPMDDKGLLRALSGTGLSPSHWYRLLNGRVFFWLCKERLQTLLNAKLYRNNIQTVLTVDTRKLVRDLGAVIELSPINSGCTKPFPHPRGNHTFHRIEKFPFDERRKTRPVASAIVELTVPYSVPEIARYVTRVEHWKSAEIVDQID